MSEKLLQNPKALCNMVRRIVLEAGEIALDHFEDIGLSDAQTKKDGSPVTIADQQTERFIEKALTDILPGILFVGEEALSEGRVDLSKPSEYYWCVDPIDGTKDFIAGEPDFTVNVALIHNGAPILGVIYAPAHGELYAGCGSGTALRWLEETNTEKNITVRKPEKSGFHAIISKRTTSKRIDQFLGNFKMAKTTRRSSSLKFCLVAAGKADLYPCFGNICYWDTAAGDAILRSAGGLVRDINGDALDYTLPKDGDFFHPPFIASSFEFDL